MKVVNTVDSCCFCVDLKSAGIMMGIIGIVMHLIYIALGNPEPMWALQLNYIGLILNACWLFGVVRKSPKPLLPILILSFSITIILLVTPTFFIVYHIVTQTNIDGFDNERAIRWIIICAILYCAGALFYYVSIVQYSLYKSFKERIVTTTNQHRCGA